MGYVIITDTLKSFNGALRVIFSKATVSKAGKKRDLEISNAVLSYAFELISWISFTSNVFSRGCEEFLKR